MHDLFLKFADHAEALAAFEAAGVTIPPGENDDVRIAYHDTGLPAGMLIVKAVGASCDGVIWSPTGHAETDGDGSDYPVMEPVEGFHINIRITDGPALPGALYVFLVSPHPETPAERFS